jgi:hypothetical protein
MIKSRHQRTIQHCRHDRTGPQIRAANVNFVAHPWVIPAILDISYAPAQIQLQL